MKLLKSNNKALSLLSNYSLLDKSFLIYTVVLIILLFTLPLFEIGSLNTTETTTFKFFNGSMLKTNILVLILLVKMFARNMSTSIRDLSYRIVGFRSNDAFVNTIFLSFLLILFFGMQDVVSLYSSNFSQRVDTTTNYTILLVYIIIGLALTLFISRKNTKASAPNTPETSDIDVPHEEDLRDTEAFKKIEQEFGGLFQE